MKFAVALLLTAVQAKQTEGQCATNVKVMQNLKPQMNEGDWYPMFADKDV